MKWLKCVRIIRYNLGSPKSPFLKTGLTTFPSRISFFIFALDCASFTYLKATAFGTTIQRCSSFAVSKLSSFP